MTATQQRFAMRQPVQGRESTAPHLEQIAPWQPVIRASEQPGGGAGPDKQSHRRTPLSLVPAPIRTSGRGFVTLCIGILVAALMTVLVTNITVSNRQYDLVTLKNEQLDLSQSNERLRQQVEHLESPQNLAAEATTLGMVNPGDVAAIDLSTGTVTGTATPADAEDQPSGRIAAPTGPDGKKADETLKQPETAAAPHAALLTEGAAKKAEDGAQSEGAKADDAAEQTAEDAEDLNGGTIPAPQFSARGN